MKNLKTIMCLSILLSSLAVCGISNASLEDGLVAYYSFTGNANDESGNGHDGTVYGASLSEDRFGNANMAYSFDGVDDIIYVDNHPDFMFQNSFSLSVWISTLSGEGQGILCFGDTDDEWRLNIETEQVRALFEYYGVNVELFGDMPEDYLGEWHHVVSVYDASTNEFSLWWDNISLNSIISPSDPTTDTLEPLSIGDSPIFRSFPFYGSIDDIRIYDRALSISEISELYNAPNPVPEPTADPLVEDQYSEDDVSHFWYNEDDTNPDNLKNAGHSAVTAWLGALTNEDVGKPSGKINKPDVISVYDIDTFELLYYEIIAPSLFDYAVVKIRTRGLPIDWNLIAFESNGDSILRMDANLFPIISPNWDIDGFRNVNFFNVP